ncbi:MAG: type II secretion system GspH family protein [Phycisphaerales bacterium]|nr:type II secretion system GspH family protein [Phycisphaerales bacterium]
MKISPFRRPIAMIRAFTLIELLVVIAIIALLVGILLPALARARQTARLVRSQTSVKQIMTAQNAYKLDYKDVLAPSIMFYGPRWMTTAYWSNPSLIPGGVPPLQTVNAPWSVGGKFCDSYYTPLGGVDIPASWRYLNPYTNPEFAVPRTEPFNVATDRSYPDRNAVSIDVWKSPGDKDSMWRSWVQGQPLSLAPVSAYDDVGTSYQQNYIWHTLFRDMANPDFAGTLRMLSRANAKLRSEAFNGGKFVVCSDQTAWKVINDSQQRRWMGEFGEYNKSVMGFLDGHSDYITMERRAATADDVNAPTGAGSLSSNKPWDYSFLIPTSN